jgi:hypothetical protein
MLVEYVDAWFNVPLHDLAQAHDRAIEVGEPCGTDVQDGRKRVRVIADLASGCEKLVSLDL